MILIDKETGQEYEAWPPSSSINWWSLNPITKKKPVDMSVFVGSGIDLEWFTSGQWCGCYMTDEPNSRYRPRMDYWFSILNLTDDYMLSKLERAGFKLAYKGVGSFKITGLKEGYCWPWECDND